MMTIQAFDRDMSFMLIEINDNQMHFQVVSRTGETVNSGVIVNQRKRNGMVAVNSLSDFQAFI